MSKQQTRRELESAIKAEQEKNAKLEHEAQERGAEIEQVREHANAEINKAQAAVDEARGKHKLAVEELTARIAELDKELAKTVEEKVAIEQQATERQAQVDKLTVALSNPAYADAALTETQDPPQPAADKEADEAEAAAENESITPHYDEYVQLKGDGEIKKARKYWREHQKEIAAEQAAVVEKEKQGEKENA
jgi:hypothetical protein